MRGFKKDIPATKAAAFADKRSFISLPKFIEGEGYGEHLVLYGEEDKGKARAEIFKRDREANGGVNRCWNCKCVVKEFKGFGMPGVPAGEWDHIRNKPGTRCDCESNGRVACRSCHKPRHPQTQFSKRISQQEESTHAGNTATRNS